MAWVHSMWIKPCRVSNRKHLSRLMLAAEEEVPESM